MIGFRRLTRILFGASQDILFGLMKRYLSDKARGTITAGPKIIIRSATLESDKFATFFACQVQTPFDLIGVSRPCAI